MAHIFQNYYTEILLQNLHSTKQGSCKINFIFPIKPSGFTSNLEQLHTLHIQYYIILYNILCLMYVYHHSIPLSHVYTAAQPGRGDVSVGRRAPRRLQRALPTPAPPPTLLPLHIPQTELTLQQPIGAFPHLYKYSNEKKYIL